ncbi:EG45-like domain containing protein [Linum grandiflorum]
MAPPTTVRFFTFFFAAVIVTAAFLRRCSADIGTASHYSAPYLPTACYGGDRTQFPTSNLFAAAGEGVWDNGASCGRQYLVRCISAVAPRTCKPGATVRVRIVDRAQSSVTRPSRGGTTLVLSTSAFAAIANGSPGAINIDFQQV